MTRTVVALLVVTLGARASAQGDGPPRDRAPHGLVVLLRDPSGRPVENARATLRCPPANVLIALQDLPAERFAALGETSVVTGTSDAGGKLRFSTDAPRAGSGLVVTERGLGALIERLRPGSTPRLTMQPMSEVTAQGGGAFTLWARSTAITGEPVAVPFAESRSAWLPAGEYEIWARRGDEWTWQRIALGSSQRLQLAFGGERHRVASRDAAWIHAANWPDVSLVEPGGAAVLLGSVPIAVSAGTSRTGNVSIDRILPWSATSRDTALPWPPPDGGAPREYRLAETFPADTVAELFVVQRTDSGSWRVAGASRADAERRFRVPEPPPGDTWLLLVAADHAPLAVPFSPTTAATELAPSRGRVLEVDAVDERGDPIVDLVLDWVPLGGDAAAVRANTDARGRADLGRVTTPGTLFVSDERFANQEVAVDVAPGGRIDVTVAAGAAIAGRVVRENGTPATGAVVTVRDSTGRLRPAARTAVVGANGEFTFVGLPAERDFVVSATITLDRKTWSGRRVAVRAGGAPLDVVVRNEDPDLRQR